MVVQRVLLLQRKPETVIHRDVKSTVKVIGTYGVPVLKPVAVEHNQGIGQQLLNHKMVVQRVLLLQRKPETVIHRDARLGGLEEHHLNLRQEGGGGGVNNVL